MEQMRNLYKILVGKFERIVLLEDLGIHGRKKLKLMLNKEDTVM
jgi:hypothetical protein